MQNGNCKSSYRIEDSSHTGEVIVSWIITHACQEVCGYCISPCKSKELTSEKEHFEIQNRLIKTGLTKMRYIGGEPLLIPHLSKLIVDAYTRSLDTRLSTNGILLTEDKFKEIEPYLNSVAFPFESIDDEWNKKIRGTEQHRKIIADRIAMVKSTSHIGILINTCVHKENINLLEALGDFISHQGIDHWKLRRFSSASGRGAVPNKKRFEITDTEFFEKVETLQRLYPNLRIDSRMPTKLSTRLMVSPQGELYRMIDKTTLLYGNILYNSLNIKEIYEANGCN